MRLFFNWILLIIVFSGILCLPIFMLINIGVFKPDFQLPLYAITEIIEKDDKVYVGLGSPFRSWFISFIGLVLIGCVNYTS